MFLTCRRSLYILCLFCVSLNIFVFCAAAAVDSAAPKPGEPTGAKARKTYAGALDWQHRHAYQAAISDFRKANEQDGGHCTACLQHAYDLAIEIGDLKNAAAIARSMVEQAATPTLKAVAHYRAAYALQSQGLLSKKDSGFTDSCTEFQKALSIAPQFPKAHIAYGISLAHLHQDDAARREFTTALAQENKDEVLRERLQRYLDNIELARARMAPPFSLVTLDGKNVSLDELAGKVVLIDFWATWCGPCREALPHIRDIAQKFQDQPLVVLSISLDKDEAKWKDFVAKNKMTWLQYRDEGFDGKIATEFGVNAIPATFTIDADGVLQDQHVGDANIEGKLKKLIARAIEYPHPQPGDSERQKLPKVTN